MAASKDASKTPPQRRRLGRGLTSLMSVPVTPSAQSDATAPPPESTAPAGPGATGIRLIRIDEIHPDPRQPRQEFDEQALQALAASIRTAGLMQPIVVRPQANRGGGFQIIVGERRWRAARMVGLDQVPALVQDIDDQTAAEWGLIENIQREDLNPLERAEAFRRLTDEYGLTHQEVAERVGLNRATVTNLLRLLDLDDFARTAVRTGRLTLGHAKVLLSVTDLTRRRHLAELTIRQDWSVRRLESRAASLSGPRRKPAGIPAAAPAARHDLERQLGDHLGTKVRIHPGKKKGTGRLAIEFYSLDQFDGLMERLGFQGSEL